VPPEGSGGSDGGGNKFNCSLAMAWPAAAAFSNQLRAAGRSGGSHRQASSMPRLVMASVLPASAVAWVNVSAHNLPTIYAQLPLTAVSYEEVFVQLERVSGP
jgi:hypothetical protein